MHLKVLDIDKITTPRETTDDPRMTCDAPKCNKPVTCKILTCGVCNKNIHTVCDPKTKGMKQKAINVINYYCSFH